MRVDARYDRPRVATVSHPSSEQPQYVPSQIEQQHLQREERAPFGTAENSSRVMTSVTGTTDHTSQDPQQISEKARKAREPVKRANFSNLPEKLRPDRLSQDADLLDDEQLFFPKSTAEKQ
jgi:hypothetical protein